METNPRTESAKTEVYSMRWFILAGFGMVTLLTMFASKSFTTANESYAMYFGVNLAVMDWAALSLYLGAAIVTPVFAWLLFKQSIGIRILSIIGTSCLLTSYVVIVLSVQFPVLYPLMVISDFLQGVAYTVGFTIGPSFAVLWFPDDQVGLAIAVDLLSQNIGVILGVILPPLTLKRLNFVNTSDNELQSFDETMWKNDTRKSLLIMYSSAIGVLMLLLVLFIIFVKDLPANPPTLALWVKRNTESLTEKSFARFIETVKLLFLDVNFILCSLVLGIGFNVIIVFYLNIAVIIEKFELKKIGIYISDDLMSGILATAYATSNIIFGFVVAKLTHRWKKYATQTLLGMGFTFVVLVALTLSFHFDNFWGFCVCVVMYSIGTRLFVIPLFEIITRHTYPIDETFVSIWVGAIGCFILVIIGEIARAVAGYASTISLLTLMCACVFVAFVLALFSHPTDKRSEVDTQIKNEGQRLLCKHDSSLEK